MKNIEIESTDRLGQELMAKPAETGACKKRKPKYIVVCRDTYSERGGQSVVEMSSEEELQQYLKRPYGVDITSMRIYEVKKIVEFKIALEFTDK